MPTAAERHKREWEELAQMDALWAVLSTPDGRYGGWDPEEFYATGRAEAEEVLQDVARFGLPRQRHAMLDFGCGVGRTTIAFARHFDLCVGLDISSEMVGRARQAAERLPQCRFILNEDPGRSGVPDETFDLVYTSLVLQHIPDRGLIETCVHDLTAAIGPGGIGVIALPTRLPAVDRWQIHGRLYRLLRRCGIPASTLYTRLHLHPARLTAVPRPRVESIIHTAGGRMLHATTRYDGGVEQTTFYVTAAD